MSKNNNNIYQRKYTVFPETYECINQNINDAGQLSKEQIEKTYFPEDIDPVIDSNEIERTELTNRSFIYNGNNLDVLKLIPENSVDSIVTDPPYGIKLMGKNWDDDVPTVELWEEAFRVLKPGGFLLSFGAPKTYHRMAKRVEDAGFKVRDQIMWVFGSGFPKSHNVSKAFDKNTSLSIVNSDGSICIQNNPSENDYEPITDDAKIWFGYGTNLKPAHEPILLAMKPCSEKTIAKNILKFGTGVLNIDACRIGDFEKGRFPANFIVDQYSSQILDEQSGIIKGGKPMQPFKGKPKNKINFISGVTQINRIGYDDLGGASKFFYCPKASKKDREEGLLIEQKLIKGRDSGQDNLNVPFKVRSKKRMNTHTTVKPTELMKYLVRLVTPKGGTVLDPFFGSGSTGKACILEGDFEFIGIEREKEFYEISVGRCNAALEKILNNQ